MFCWSSNWLLVIIMTNAERRPNTRKEKNTTHNQVKCADFSFNSHMSLHSSVRQIDSAQSIVLLTPIYGNESEKCEITYQTQQNGNSPLCQIANG